MLWQSTVPDRTTRPIEDICVLLCLFSLTALSVSCLRDVDSMLQSLAKLGLTEKNIVSAASATVRQKGVIYSLLSDDIFSNLFCCVIQNPIVSLKKSIASNKLAIDFIILFG